MTTVNRRIKVPLDLDARIEEAAKAHHDKYAPFVLWCVDQYFAKHRNGGGRPKELLEASETTRGGKAPRNLPPERPGASCCDAGASP